MLSSPCDYEPGTTPMGEVGGVGGVGGVRVGTFLENELKVGIELFVGKVQGDILSLIK